MADFWIAVGAVRERVLRRWVAKGGERPREVNGKRPGERGALEGGLAGSVSGIDVSFGGWGLEVGLEVKREETTSLGFDVVWWGWGGLGFSFFAGGVSACLGAGAEARGFRGIVLFPVRVPSPCVRRFRRRRDFLACRRSFQRPPLKTGLVGMKASEMAKFISSPSSAISQFGASGQLSVERSPLSLIIFSRTSEIRFFGCVPLGRIRLAPLLELTCHAVARISATTPLLDTPISRPIPLPKSLFSLYLY